MNKQKGFTIIELLVVVAIIAVLAAIVLVNVTSYITKGKDAAARGNLATALTNAAVYYDTNGNYDDWITNGTGSAGDPTWLSVYNALNNAGYTLTTSCDVANCAATSTAWCAMFTLKASTNTYCVDSTGNKTEKAGGTCAAGVCG